MICKIILFLTVFFLVILHAQHGSEWDWYAYYYNGKLIGYSQGVYEYEKESNLHFRKRTKTMNMPQEETEEISLVLNNNYTVRSLYLTNEKNNKNQLIVLTVGNDITVQTSSRIYTFPLKHFYFQIEDFLRYLVTQKLQQGKYYKSAILATNHIELIYSTARYIGRKSIVNQGENLFVHEFSVTSDELANNWVKAYISMEGKLVYYEMGNFLVVNSSKEEILKVSQHLPLIKVPYICDIEKIDRIYMDKNFVVDINNYYQKIVEGKIIIRQVNCQDDYLISQDIKQQHSNYLKKEDIFPVEHERVLEMAQIAAYGAVKPKQKVKNISSWLYTHLSSLQGKYSSDLQGLFGITQDSYSIATVTFCRNQGMPARVAKGFLLSPGVFTYTSWCEVFLGEWLPVYQGHIGEARFIKISDDLTDNHEQIAKAQLSFAKVIKNNEEIVFDKMSNLISVSNNYFHDYLLGIGGVRPADWAFLPKDIFSNTIVFRSLQGKGPAILVKVIHSNQTIDEVLESLLGKTINSNVKVLWKNQRQFNNINGVEGALESNNFIYQAFIGAQNNKMILVLLFVPKGEFQNIREQFFHFLSSLKFM